MLFHCYLDIFCEVQAAFYASGHIYVFTSNIHTNTGLHQGFLIKTCKYDLLALTYIQKVSDNDFQTD